jgi:hypothetical protein
MTWVSFQWFCVTHLRVFELFFCVDVKAVVFTKYLIQCTIYQHVLQP